jgi:hypothetical protein
VPGDGTTAALAAPPLTGESAAGEGRLGLVGAWGILGVAATFAQAVTKLAPVAAAALRDERLGARHVAFLAAWSAFCVYVEGYRAFQKRFCPRVVARAVDLGARPRALDSLLAPAYCMGLFRAPRRLLMTSWGVVLGVSTIVVIVRTLPQPLRGLVDAGVLLALAWGLACLGYFTLRAALGARTR